MPESASRGGGVLSPGGCLVPGGWCLLQGGLLGGGCLVPGGVSSGGCLLQGGGVSAPEADTPLWTESQTPVKTLPWPNFVAAGNKRTFLMNANRFNQRTVINTQNIRIPKTGNQNTFSYKIRQILYLTLGQRN